MIPTFDWSKATVVSPSDAPVATGPDYLHRVGESFFGVLGPDLVSRGWSCFPQRRDGNRGPGTCGGAAIAWGSYQRQLPTRSEVEQWALENYAHNVAFVTGPVSGGLIVLDIDCDDIRVAAPVRRLAMEILGETPFVRVGRAPRSALWYRLPQGDSYAKCAKRFAVDDGTGTLVADPRNSVEVLSNGSPITGYGKHHKSGDYIKWHGAVEPMWATPADLPLCSSRQLEEFFRALHELRPLWRPEGYSSPGARVNPAQGAAFITYRGTLGDIYRPVFGPAVDGRWEVRGDLVVGGREAFLASWTWSYCRHNERYVRAGREDALLEAAESLMPSLLAKDGTHDATWLRRQLREKIWRMSRQLRDRDSFARPVRGASGDWESPACVPLPESRPADGALDWIGEGDVAPSNRRRRTRTTKPVLVPGAREARALLADRTGLTARITDGITSAIDGFLADVAVESGRVHVVPASTGAGKTSRVVPRLVEHLLAHPDPEGRPIIFVAPSHENLAEIAKLAEGAGASFGDGPGLESMIFMGKVRAGCERAEDVALLTKAHIGTSGLCKTVLAGDDGEEPTTSLCPFFAHCGYQRMLRRATTARLILLPRAYLTQPTLPARLRNPLAVVMDESLVSELLGEGSMPLDALTLDRAEPVPTKRERAEGLTAEDLTLGRLKAVPVAMRAIRERKDVAASFATAEDGDKYLGDARRVCASAMTRTRGVSPQITRTGIEALIGAGTGTHLAIEYRFWTIVRERYDGLMLDRSTPLSDADGKPSARARGPRDSRIHLRMVPDETGKIVEKIQLSWRPTANWGGAPTLLLDASADVEVLEHVLAAQVVTTPIDVPQDLRLVVLADETHSPSSYAPPADAKPERRGAAARRRSDARDIVSLLTGAHAHGRVGVIGAQKVLPLILDGWTRPSNLDQGHFGAMRGLNVFSDHLCALVVGRTELPIHVVDALAGALTWDMDEPEYPLDALGTGVDANGNAIFRSPEPRTIQLRSGHDTTITVAEMPGRWARKIDAAWRDEETRQALGRLRTSHRREARGTATAVIMSTCVPSGLIVDEVTSVVDLLASPGVWVGDALRLAGGVLCPRITPRLSPYTAERVAEFVDGIAKPSRLHWGYTPVEWTDAAGVVTNALVATHIEDPEGALLAAISEAGMDGEAVVASVVIGTPVRPRVDSVERAPDKVSSRYLTPDQARQRHAAFAEWRSALTEAHESEGVLRARFEMETVG